MKIVRVLTALVALATVSACATPFQVAEVQDVMAAPSPVVGTPFTKALFEEYKEATRHEAIDEYEWRHAVVYARKAERAATGEVVPPENPADWDVPVEAAPVLQQARAALMDDFDKGARERVPVEAAKAQVSLDCWIEEEWEREKDPGCKTTFLATEPKLKPPAVPATVEAPAPAQPLVIPFDYNKAEINASAMQTLYDAAPALKAAKPMVIRIHGFTDTVGGKPYNKSLSERRAKAVADQLKKLGVEGVSVEVVGFGKEKLAVPTKNNVKEQRNRRAEVTWETAR
ncbi:MAG: OmpA family protein [Phaeospirillum sp.]|nr:OmpA family protein [Phaeospirillum sp.]